MNKIFCATTLTVAICAGTVFAAQRWDCKGTYPGSVIKGANQTIVALQKVDTSTLSSYHSVKPKTGGNRVFVYFDVSKTTGAEYCLFVYRDRWTLRKASQGMYSIEVGTGITKNAKPNVKRGFVVRFNNDLIKGKINRCWNFHMGH